MKSLPGAALLLFTLLMAPPAMAFETVEGRLTPRNLAGNWGIAFVYMQREGGSTHIRRRLPNYYLEFEQVKGKRVWLKKIAESSNEVLRRTRIKVRRRGKTFGVVLSSNSVLVRKGIPFYYLDLLHSQNGVDVMKEGDTGSTVLIRFRRTKEAVEAGFGELRFKEFCGGPVRLIAKPAKAELNAAERLVKRYPRILRRYRVSNAARMGLFLSPEFKRAFGKEFDDFSDEAQTQFLERLKYCAVAHPDRSMAEAIGKAVLSTTARRNVRGFLRLGNTSSRYPSLKLAVVGGAVHFLARKRKIAIKDFEKLIGSFEVETADQAKLESVLQEIGTLANDLSASRIEGVVYRVSRRLAMLKGQAKRRHQEELERNGPALSERELIHQAAERYFLKNCNRMSLAALAAQSKSSGSALAGILLSRPVVMPTHILSFGVRNIRVSQCSGGATPECKFLLSWSCRFRPNSAFGLRTREFDPVCPLIRAAPVAMTGRFVRKSRRTWHATTLKW